MRVGFHLQTHLLNAGDKSSIQLIWCEVKHTAKNLYALKCNNSFEVSTLVDGVGDAVEPDLRSVRIRVVVRSGVLFLEPQFAACRPHIDESVPCVFRHRARRLDTPLAFSFRLQYVRSVYK